MPQVLKVILVVWLLLLFACAPTTEREVPGYIAAAYTELHDGDFDRAFGGRPTLCATIEAEGSRVTWCGEEGSNAARLHDLGVGAKVIARLREQGSARPRIVAVLVARGNV